MNTILLFKKDGQQVIFFIDSQKLQYINQKYSPFNQTKNIIVENATLYIKQKDEIFNTEIPCLDAANDSTTIVTVDLDRNISIYKDYNKITTIPTKTVSGDIKVEKIGQYFVVLLDETIYIIKNDDVYCILHNVTNFSKHDSGVFQPVAVIVTCYPPYLPYLPECIESIDRQNLQPVEKILVLDHCHDFTNTFDGWKIVHGDWYDVSSARNEGLKHITQNWVIYFDADNIMDENYIEHLLGAAGPLEDSRVGLVYPQIHYTKGRMVTGGKIVKPYDYWQLKKDGFIDTASLWNRNAITSVGGWKKICKVEDYLLACEIAKIGWEVRSSEARLLFEQHPQILSRNKSITNSENFVDYCMIHSLAIVTLFSGRMDILEAWSNWIKNEKFPLNTNLFVVDNSNNEQFKQALIPILSELPVSSFRYYRSTDKFNPVENIKYKEYLKHLHVAKLYNLVIPEIKDDLILTLEDDVIPEYGAIEKFIDYIRLHGECGSLSGVYPVKFPETRTANQSFSASSYDKNYWTYPIPMADIDNHTIPFEVGINGGGFTLWPMWALKDTLPFIATWEWDRDHMFGWDTHICRKLRANGYKIILHPDVKCQHI